MDMTTFQRTAPAVDQAMSANHHGRELPNARVRLLLLAIQEVLGRGSLMTVLRQARLHRFTTGLPKYDRGLRLHAGEYAALIQAIEAYYGRGARGTLLRIGQASFQQLLAHERVRAVSYRMAFLTMSREARRLTVLRWLAEDLAYPGGRVEAQADGSHVLFLDYEGDGVLGRRRETPGCWLTVGKLQEALRWAVGREHEVVETACKSMGAPACRFEINEIA